MLVSIKGQELCQNSTGPVISVESGTMHVELCLRALNFNECLKNWKIL